MQYKFSYNNDDLINLVIQNPQYGKLVSKILNAENDAVREMYEIELFNNWFN